MSIRLVDAGTVPYLRSQTVYHGVARARTKDTPDTVILVRPEEPYVCIGYHQDLEKEVDVNFCKAHNIPIVRREVGGGAVYLDANQLFTQWVFSAGHLPMRIERRFEFYSRSLVQTYQALGIDAYYRPINDIQVRNKKIGGTGAGALGNAEVVVGSLMFDFDFELMARVLVVPNEKFRDKIYQSLQEYMTTMKKELGAVPSLEMVKDLYIEQCEALLGEKLVQGTFTERELAAMEQLNAKFTSSEWLFQKGGLNRHGVKIHNDVWLYETKFKARGGMIRATVRSRNNLIDDISLSGDFTFHPQSQLRALEKTLVNTEISSARLAETVHNFYQTAGVQSPGVEPEDWVEVILQAQNVEKLG
ncbi:MAG: biotin/lipoate A/B protein ligase family protein [bacterium]